MSTIDFHVTSKCSQACPYCWGPRRFRNPLDTETARRVIAYIRELGIRRIVFTGGDPLQRLDAVELVKYAKTIGLETALSTTGDLITPAILQSLSPFLDLISLPLDGSTEEINSKTKHRGHYAAIMRSLDWLRMYPSIDVKVCTPVTRSQGSFSPLNPTSWSAYFDGSTGYLTSTGSSSLSLSGDFTIEMWINSSSTRGRFPVLLSRNAAWTASNNVYICYKRTDRYFAALSFKIKSYFKNHITNVTGKIRSQ